MLILDFFQNPDKLWRVSGQMSSGMSRHNQRFHLGNSLFHADQ
jgi:hypothetical protein